VSSANHFLILNGVIVTLLLVYFFGFRGKSAPARLNFKKSETPLQTLEKAQEDASGRVLNVMFNYNGHSFDAYEVLGVPAGSTLQEIEQIYSQSLQQLVDPSSKQFYKTAYEAIRNQAKIKGN
jgi:hypothetical protein